MKYDDSTLIQLILNGEQNAFTSLVEKYQKQVHAFAWRKLGDFHLAEEITQDTFLQVYQKLYTLRDPNRFAAWLHAIVKNCCNACFRKTQMSTESLDALSDVEVERIFYNRYLEEQREKNAIEKRHEVVNHLLNKLNGNEKTVMTLHYLGDMPCEEISEFLNVPLNTIKSRLHRARKRLKEEEFMVRETLGGFELPYNLTENIMQWIQMNEPGVAASVGTLTKTSDGTLYAVMGYENIYKLPVGENEWQPVNTEFLRKDTKGDIPIAEHNGTLYIIPSDELFASTDEGKTWDSIGSCPEGHVKELLIAHDTFYLSLNNGIFQSENGGNSWTNLNDGLDQRLIENSGIRQMCLYQDTLFIGTYLGIYRLKNATWEHLHLPMDNTVVVSSLAVTEEHIYAAVSVNILEGDKTPAENFIQLRDGGKDSWWIFRSNNIDDSWTDITPMDARDSMNILPSITLLAADKTLLLIGKDDGVIFHSTDSGLSWQSTESSSITPMRFSVNCAVALDKDTFFTGGTSGIHRSMDGGKTWHRFNTRFECRVDNLVCIKTNPDSESLKTLFATVAGSLVKSNDSGSSWTAVDIKLKRDTYDTSNKNPQKKYKEQTPNIVQISEVNGILYAKVIQGDSETAFCRYVPEENCLIPVENMMPSLNSRQLTWYVFGNVTFPFKSKRLPGQGLLITITSHPKEEPETLLSQVINENPQFGAECFLKQLEQIQGDHQLAYELILEGLYGNFAINMETYYMEYNYKLFQWKLGDTEWSDTGIQETCELTRDNISRGIKIATLGDVVYVGKRDGHLIQSLDSGVNWSDITSDLPQPIRHFNQIIFADSTVYISTDTGVFCSNDGNVWYGIKDPAGESVIIKSLATDDDVVYGANDDCIYKLDRDTNTWEQVVPEIPDSITSLIADRDTFYVGTEHRGVLCLER